VKSELKISGLKKISGPCTSGHTVTCYTSVAHAIQSQRWMPVRPLCGIKDVSIGWTFKVVDIRGKEG
jgi:hypothetical protein